MATTKKGLTARIAAGTGAFALATLVALGGALPASAAPNIEPDTSGSITVHKYEQPVERGEIGTGAPLTELELDGLTPVAGVDFTVTQVTNLDVLDNATWTTLQTLDAADVLAADSGYTLGTPTEQTTSATGLATFTGLPVGVYLVQETGVPVPSTGGPNVVIPTEPFLVVIPQPIAATNDWLYDVHVYPKNTTALATKSIEAADHQVLDTDVTWTIESNSPVPTQGTTLDSYVISDVLDSRLEFVEGSVTVSVDGAPLSSPGDFTVNTLVGTGGTLEVTFTEDGRDALLAAPGADVVVTFDTLVTAVGSGMIANTGAVVINGTSVPTNTVTDYWGAVELLKHDGNPAGELPGRGLEGAVFELRDSEGVALLDGADPIRYTSDENGMIEIDGLRTASPAGLGYQLVEITAPDGYMLPAVEADRVHAFTVAPGVDAEIEVTVENEQFPPYALPITGGSGQAAFMIGGAGLILGALGFLLIRRRQAQLEA